MPQHLRMPSEQELRPGPRREFVAELHMHWRAARRPNLRTVEENIAAGDYRGSISRESFRRMMRGLTVPTNRINVEAVLEVLCHLSNTDPNADRWPDEYYDGAIVTYRDHLARLWDDALDEPPPAPARTSPSSWDDDPPF